MIVLGCTFKTTAGDSVLSVAKPKANAFLRRNRELGRGRTATLYPGSGPVALVGERPAWSLSRSDSGSRQQFTRGVVCSAAGPKPPGIVSWQKS